MRSLTSFLRNREYDKRAVRGLEWMWDRRDGFLITSTPEDDMPWEVKPLAELMFMLTVLRRNEFDYSLIDPLAEHAIKIADDFDWHQLAAYDPSAATPLALVAKFYEMEGRPVPFEETYFRFLNRIHFFDGMDRLPYRQMDFAYSLGLVGIKDYEQKIPTWFANTACGRGQHPARYSIGDLYSLTHAIFYLTDVGLEPTAAILDEETNLQMRRQLVSLTGMMVRGDNVDVLGELLLCCLMCGLDLRGRDGLIFRWALQSLEKCYCSDGSLPPTRALVRKAKEGKATFAELYHTTLVSVLLNAYLTKANLS